MKHIAWITDIHLNFLELNGVKDFCRNISDQKPDAVLIGGDIGEAPTVKTYLQILENEIQCPIYFVLGNHDFYGGSIADVKTGIKDFSSYTNRIHWLSNTGIVELTEKTCLIGHDSWADGRLGNFYMSNVALNDYVLIEELTDLNQYSRLEKLNELGDEAAAKLRSFLQQTLDSFHCVLFLTHAPPFKESCWHEGKISDDNYLPHFSCKAVGDVLFEFSKSYPEKEMTVLCGHTHGAGQVQILPNLKVKTGGAEYGNPQLQELLIIE